MRRMAWGLLFLLAYAASAFAWNAADSGIFEAAHKKYREGKFKDAAAGYEQLAAKYPEAADIYYNLGNSYYRAGELGPSILAFKRAAYLDPRDRDIRHNLRQAQDRLEYRIADKRNWYLKAAAKVLDFFTEPELRFFALAVSFLFFAILGSRLFLARGAVWGTGIQLLLLLALLAGGMAVTKNVQIHWIREAVVMAGATKARYGPSEGDQVAFKLAEGLVVYVVDSREDWSRVFLANGESGWVPNANLAEVMS